MNIFIWLLKIWKLIGKYFQIPKYDFSKFEYVSIINMRLLAYFWGAILY